MKKLSSTDYLYLDQEEEEQKKMVFSVVVPLVFYKGDKSGFIEPKTVHEKNCVCPPKRKEAFPHGNKYRLQKGGSAGQVIPYLVGNLDDLKWFKENPHYEVVLGERDLSEHVATRYDREFKRAVALVKRWKTRYIPKPKLGGDGIVVLDKVPTRGRTEKNNGPDKETDTGKEDETDSDSDDETGKEEE